MNLVRSLSKPTLCLGRLLYVYSMVSSESRNLSYAFVVHKYIQKKDVCIISKFLSIYTEPSLRLEIVRVGAWG